MSANHYSGDFDIPSDLGEARRVQDAIEEALRASQYTERDIFAIKLALEEALVNAIKHGNQMDPEKRVRGSYQITPERFDVRIADEGTGFNPDELPDPTDPTRVELCCGRGVFLIRGFMTEVKYHAPGNVVTMCKVREPQSI
jgi:serine/threonine-protein kinase RsbW